MNWKRIIVGAALTGSQLAAGEVISIASLKAGEVYRFRPDFAPLAYYTRKCEVDGWDPVTRLFLVTGTNTECYLNANAGTTQYQGHYVWLTNKVVSGFGTYTSAKTSRSFGWIFRNDTGADLSVTRLATVFGQWGARNSQPDRLGFSCKVSPLYIDPTDADGWLQSPEDVFTTPYTNKASEAHFPVFECRTLGTNPGKIPRTAYFAVRFTDTCPASGNNAHLGIAAFEVVFAGRKEGLEILFY